MMDAQAAAFIARCEKKSLALYSEPATGQDRFLEART
jgi:hypothetical protein